MDDDTNKIKHETATSEKADSVSLNSLVSPQPLNRKQRAEKRRLEEIQKIFDVIFAEWERTEDFTKALEAGDRYWIGIVRSKPQEKEFYISCAERCKQYLEQALTETQKKSVAG